MFYEENEINELIICPYCKTKYNDPRLMECGDSFCMPCIELLINNSEKGFKCPVGNDFHEQILTFNTNKRGNQMSILPKQVQ